jgi:hypothetical protein
VRDVAILGAGPSGLMAALAIEQSGHKPYILSHKEPSQMSGAMYLHQAIPELTSSEPDDYIQISKMGTAEGYAKKVYHDPNHPVSFTRFKEGIFPMWYLGDAYMDLWRRFEHRIHDYNIDTDKLPAVFHNFSLVINTIPLNQLCMNHEHTFDYARVWIQTGYYEGSEVANIMIYNGLLESSWYRFSRINRVVSYEFGREVSNSQSGLKPTRNTCTCWSDIRNLFFIGRYGRWEKNYLSHHAYLDAQNIIALFDSVHGRRYG